MAIEVPALAVTGAVIPASWGNNVRNSISEINPSGANPGEVMVVNSGSDGYDFEVIEHPLVISSSEPTPTLGLVWVDTTDDEHPLVYIAREDGA